MNTVYGLMIGVALIFIGLLMNSCESRGVSNSLVSLTEETTEQFENVNHKLDMIMYGQLVGGGNSPIVVTK